MHKSWYISGGASCAFNMNTSFAGSFAAWCNHPSHPARKLLCLPGIMLGMPGFEAKSRRGYDDGDGAAPGEQDQWEYPNWSWDDISSVTVDACLAYG